MEVRRHDRRGKTGPAASAEEGGASRGGAGAGGGPAQERGAQRPRARARVGGPRFVRRAWTCWSKAWSPGMGRSEAATCTSSRKTGNGTDGYSRERFAHKTVKVVDLAMKNGAPIIGIHDAGDRREHEGGLGALGAYADIFFRNVMASRPGTADCPPSWDSAGSGRLLCRAGGFHSDGERPCSALPHRSGSRAGGTGRADHHRGTGGIARPRGDRAA